MECQWNKSKRCGNRPRVKECEKISSESQKQKNKEEEIQLTSYSVRCFKMQKNERVQVGVGILIIQKQNTYICNIKQINEKK